MAVANVAVELGHRNRRRVIKGTIWLASIGVVVAAVALLFRPDNQSGPGVSGATRAIGNGVPSTPIHDRIASIPLGTTKQQVRRLMGAPTKVVGNCWQYAVNEPAYTVHQGKVSIEGVENADRLCFGWPGGVYTSTWVEQNGTWLNLEARMTGPPR